MIIIPGTSLPILSNPGASSDLRNGKQLIDSNGQIITGSMPNPSIATPSISVSSAGLITATSTQEEGYVNAGSKNATKQLTTQAGTTITPGTSQKTACASGRYTTGTIYVAGDADLKASNIKSGVTIFGVTGTYGSGLSETILMHLSTNSITPYSTSGSYYKYKIYYNNNASLPSNPSSGEGKWTLASYTIILAYSNALVASGSAWGSGGQTIDTSIGAYGFKLLNMSEGSTNNKTYCEFQILRSTVQNELGSYDGTLLVMHGSYLIFSSTIIWPEND